MSNRRERQRSPLRTVHAGVLTPAFIICLSFALYAGLLAATFDWELLDHHLFRQAQTATAIRELMRDGPWLAYRIPVLGPPWTVPFEFPLYQIISAKIAGLLELEARHGGRMVAAVSGALCVAALARLAYLLSATRLQIVTISLVFGLSPMMIYWSNAVMIETFALAASLVMTVCACEYLYRDRVWALAGGTLAAICAALAKSTTFGLYLLFVFALFSIEFLRVAWFGFAFRRSAIKGLAEHFLQRVLAGVFLLGPALLIGYAYVDFADRVKTQSVLTGWLTSANLSQWNFGGSRLESLRPIVHDFYAGQPPVLVEALGVLGPVLLALAAMGLLAAGPRYWLRAGGLGLGFLSGPLIFANLYMVHNYYWVAVLPFGAAFIALGLERLIALVARLARRAGLPVGRRRHGVLFAVFALAFAGSSAITMKTFFLDPPTAYRAGLMGAAEAVRAHTEPDDIVHAFGLTWSPALQYFMDRRAVMGTHAGDLTVTYALEQGLEPAALVLCESQKSKLDEYTATPLFAGSWQLVAENPLCQTYVRG